MPRDATRLSALAVLVVALLVGAFLFGRQSSHKKGGGRTSTQTHTRTGKGGGQDGGGKTGKANELQRLLAKATPGQTITLEGRAYGSLKVAGRSFSSPVHVVGQAGTTLAGLHIMQSHDIVFSGFKVTPDGTKPAKIALMGSSNITFDHIDVDGVRETQGAQMEIARDASNITITNSTFSECGEGKFCIRPGGTGITIAHDTFHDCIDCDFVHGGGHAVSVTDSTFDRSEPGTVGSGHHNDLIQIMGGGPWTITGNRFGDRHGGAAQIFVNPGIHNDTNNIHDITIRSNFFSFHKANMLFAVKIGTGKRAGQAPPANVRIVNNTFTTGTASSVWLGPGFASVPAAQQPVVANNVLFATQADLCKRGTIDHNLIESGPTCSATNLSGKANLDASGQPQAGSPVINAADPAYAPTLDMLGRPRNGKPDIGAFEAK